MRTQRAFKLALIWSYHPVLPFIFVSKNVSFAINWTMFADIMCKYLTLQVGFMKCFKKMCFCYHEDVKTVGINGSTDIAKSRILQERGKTIQARY